MSAGLSSLKQALRGAREATKKPESLERCTLCGQELAHTHRHLVEIATQRLVCSCDACALLFSGQAKTRYRQVPRRARSLDDFQLSDAQWDSLLIPINMAFFFHSTPHGRPVAIYPSPAGAMESMLELACWSELVEANPVLKTMEPDVEALLVNRVSRNSPGDASGWEDQPRYFLVPIDECYKLVGLIRANWRGLSGGQEVWRQIEHFFSDLRERASVAR